MSKSAGRVRYPFIQKHSSFLPFIYTCSDVEAFTGVFGINMKFLIVVSVIAVASTASAFQASLPTSARLVNPTTALSMILEKPAKIAKIEQLKIDSDHLVHPLKEVRLLGCSEWNRMIRRRENLRLLRLADWRLWTHTFVPIIKHNTTTTNVEVM
jgi:hypothetical protein